MIAAMANKLSGHVVVLEHMLEIADLVDDAEFKDIKEDVEAECSKYGKVLVTVSLVVWESGREGGEG